MLTQFRRGCRPLPHLPGPVRPRLPARSASDSRSSSSSTRPTAPSPPTARPSSGRTGPRPSAPATCRAAASSRAGPTTSGRTPTPAKYNGDNPAGHPGDDPLVANGVAGESGATNLGPRSQELVDYTKSLIDYWHARGVNPTSDLVTTSGSGHRPRHHARRTRRPRSRWCRRPPASRPATLQRLISQQTQGMQLGFLGSPYVNVLQLNEALAKLET